MDYAELRDHLVWIVSSGDINHSFVFLLAVALSFKLAFSGIKIPTCVCRIAIVVQYLDRSFAGTELSLMCP